MRNAASVSRLTASTSTTNYSVHISPLRPPITSYWPAPALATKDWRSKSALRAYSAVLDTCRSTSRAGMRAGRQSLLATAIRSIAISQVLLSCAQGEIARRFRTASRGRLLASLARLATMLLVSSMLAFNCNPSPMLNTCSLPQLACRQLTLTPPPRPLLQSSPMSKFLLQQHFQATLATCREDPSVLCKATLLSPFFLPSVNQESA